MTEEEAKQLLASKPKQTFYGQGTIKQQRIKNPRYEIDFVGDKEDVLSIQGVLGGAPFSLGGGRWVWNLYGPKAESLAEEMVPLLLEGDITARQKAMYIIRDLGLR